MKVEKTDLEGVILITPDIYPDDRGMFYEGYSYERYREVIGEHAFVQDNFSYSKQNVIRGLHYQVGKYAQGKLCQVLTGSVLDVVVDIRKKSSTFGKHVSIELHEGSKNQLWIPPGFAHGFSVIGSSALFYYKCTAAYSREHERILCYNDPALGIHWKNTSPIVSKKDSMGRMLAEIENDFS